MSPLSSPEVFAPLAGYLIAAVAYAIHFRQRSAFTRILATTALRLVAAVQLAVLIGQGLRSGQAPFGSVAQGLAAAALAVALCQILVETLEAERATGMWGAGLAFALQSLAALLHRQELPGPVALASPGVAIHLGLAIAAGGAWLLAATLGFLLLNLQRQTTTGRFTGLIGNLPRLAVLDRMTTAALWGGFMAICGSTVAGALWSGDQYPSGPLRDPRYLVLFTLAICYGIGIVAVIRRGSRPALTAAVALGGAGLMVILLLAGGLALQPTL